MKHRHRGSREPLYCSPDFEDALESVDHSARRQAERKTWQFCRQVQRALNLALTSGEVVELGNLFVEEVTPAPDCGRLLVSVVLPDDRPAGDVIRVLGQAAPRLRAQVAAAISRKRAPELSFVPVSAEGGFDE